MLNFTKSFAHIRRILFASLALVLIAATISQAAGKPKPRQMFYSVRIYQLRSDTQETRVHKYLKEALLPALHRLGIPLTGVFTPVGNDTAAIRRIYVLIPANSLQELTSLPEKLQKDQQYLNDGKDYLDAPYDAPAYLHFESILLQAFPDAPQVTKPGPFNTPPAQRIYELRSYEGPTEPLFANKVRMFNQGGEVPLFQRLGFNAVFYGSVIAGAHMPNLMYMTSFEDMPAREAHWKAFGADPFWKKLSSDPQYQHNVSHIDITFLHPTDYSDL